MTDSENRVTVLFVCMGNICRSPTAEGVFHDTFVVTTYGHWVQGEAPYILSVRFKLKELDALAGQE